MPRRGPKPAQQDFFAAVGMSLSRRAMPPPPVLHHTIPDEVDARRRYCDAYVWLAHRPTLAWLTDHPARHGSHTARRCVAWSYRYGYGGALLLNIYPRIQDPRAPLDLTPETSVDVTNAATIGAAMARRLRVANLVLVTGKMDQQDEDDLRGWLRVFQAKCPCRWKCLAVTEQGWPAAIATSGRAPLPEDLPLVPWAFPEPLRGRRQTPHAKPRPDAITSVNQEKGAT